MASYVVMLPPEGGEEERAVLVRDGFRFLAFLVPVIWLLFHRMWLAAAAAFVLAFAIGATEPYFGGVASTALAVLVATFFGMEGAALKIAALRRRGWHEWGVVEAASPGEAELRFLVNASPDDAEEPLAVPTIEPAAARARTPSGPVLGLLGYPARG